jgi:hypothetical protein
MTAAVSRAAAAPRGGTGAAEAPDAGVAALPLPEPCAKTPPSREMVAAVAATIAPSAIRLRVIASVSA